MKTKWLLIVSLWLGACADVDGPSDVMDAGTLDASADAGESDDGGGLIDKQNGSEPFPTRWPRPEDALRLPHSIKIVPQGNNGWSTNDSAWLYALCGEGTCPGTAWGRDQNQSWYRNHSLSNSYSYYYQSYPGATCHAAFFGGWCGTGVNRVDLACPTRMQWSAVPSEWRSGYIGSDPQAFWFYYWQIGVYRWRTNADRIQMDPIGVRASGNRLVCDYRPLQPGQLYLDVWLWKI